MKKQAYVTAALLSAALLAGCDMSTPSQVSLKPIEIRRSVKTETLDARHVDPSRAQSIADSYAVNNGGSMTITVSYLKGNAKSAAAARKGGVAWKNLLVKDGVPQVSVDAVAVDDPAYAGKAVVAWPARLASAPKDCGRITGYRGAEPLGSVKTYAMGCETESILAKQIVNPDDLMGRGGLPGDESRRQGAVTDKYLSGKPNTKLNGVSASGTAGGAGGG
jgi:type IV pilus biogenesis protein CpaD/CtpE